MEVIPNHKNTNIDDLPNEIWVDIIGFDGIFECSNFGRIKSLGRWVNNGKSQRWVKERIKKQSLCKKNRLTCTLNINGKAISINVPKIIFLSFNPNVDLNIKTHCVMHKNKIIYDNRIDNLIVSLISESHKLNFKKGLLPHLKINNDKKKIENSFITEKICKKCNENKKINQYRVGYKTCLKCFNEERNIKYKIIKQLKK